MPKEDPFVNRAQLLKAIKKYPEIWDSNNKLHMCRSVTAPMWNEIAEQFGGHVPTVKLQSIWSQMKYHYHNLVHRQILHKERFTTKWEHFEPMSFMYNITVAKIVGAAGANDGNQTQHLQSPTAVSLPTPPPTPTTPQTQGRGRPSGSFTWLPAQQQQQTQTQQLQQQLVQTPLSTQMHEQLTPGGMPQPLLTSTPLPTQTEVSVETSPFIGFTGLVPPAAITVEATTTPMRKPGRPGSMNNSMRGRIIDVIKAHPPLWVGRQQEAVPGQRKAQNRTSAVWKEVAAELGLTASLVQTRWSIIKQRYVDELQKERRAHFTQQAFHSTWEHFERMDFMRDILIKKVDEREQTREQIQEIVSEHQQLQSAAAQHMRYMRLGMPPPMSMLGPPSGVYEDGSVVGMVPLHQTGGVVSGVGGVAGAVGMGRRLGAGGRVKTESDLEWDPFEMILHVHGTEPAAN
ncbi:uncharacterized protein LOC120776669 [Bactrocera tryoni]|uniref:Uncharacterized protein LOC105222409 n=1 Tax=Bactrocera dorsalis TaxID=27457 RepID=A0ABM3JV47_BACDO|nr:uncharacterized protein LOC120776669 [Bactrocera tryoni]XP_049313102.1 uncharacterized protein LOC105222409 [Bactrocera dorsalis]